MLSTTPTLFSVFNLLYEEVFQARGGLLGKQGSGSIYRLLDLICEGGIWEPPPWGSSPRVDHYLLYLFITISQNIFVLIIKVSIFLVGFHLFLARITRLHILYRIETETGSLRWSVYRVW
ncbi:hypothetical protein Hanom_Chr15g01386831 [Helianthus anomalus]